MPFLKKTKILATLGPACSSKEVLREMMLAGADVFRLNFSHADYEGVKEKVRFIRELNEELGRNTGILADLQGPKLRVGAMKEGVVLEPGDQIDPSPLFQSLILFWMSQILTQYFYLRIF